MPWQTLHVPVHPRTRRTADGTFYTHDGTGQMRVRDHHVAELTRQGGVLPPGARVPQQRGARPVAPLVRPLSPPVRPVPPPPPLAESPVESPLESPGEEPRESWTRPPAKRGRHAE